MKQFFYLLPLICALLVVGPIEAKKKKYPNGDYYEGEWKKGVPHGKGTMKYANGNIYEGNWILGERKGHGIMKYVNRDIYEGNWVSGMISGQGTMKYANGSVYVGMWQNGKKHGKGSMSSNLFNQCLETGEWRNDRLYTGKVIKESQLGQVITEYKAGLGKTFLKSKKGGWEFNGKISYNNLPLSGTIIKGKYQLTIDCSSDKYFGTLFFEDGSDEKEEIPSPSDSWAFEEWIETAFAKIEKTNNQLKELERENEQERLRVEAEFKAKQKRLEEELKAKEEERKAKEEDKKWAQITKQLPYYIWQPSEIKNVYDTNPARLRSATQNKYVVFYGTIADIKESRNVEWNQFLEDYVEYKYYTIRLNGGIYFESRNANFVSNLSRGQQSYFVAKYTDRQSFNRPLFDLVMYARSIEELTSLLRKTNIGLDRLMSR